MKIPSPLLSADGNNLLSDGASIVARWREYFSTLLNRPLVDPPPSLIQAASEATVGLSIPIAPSISETYKAIRKIKAGKASGICSIHPEYTQQAGGEAMRYLTDLFCTIWETETVPEEWHQGIIIPLYKVKGSRSDCLSYRGITLLSVPGKVFSHVLLARIRPVLLAHRRQPQSGFTPGRSTFDRILTLNLMAQRRREFGHPTYAAYVDLRSAFDSISRPALWLICADMAFLARSLTS